METALAVKAVELISSGALAVAAEQLDFDEAAAVVRVELLLLLLLLKFCFATAAAVALPCFEDFLAAVGF